MSYNTYSIYVTCILTLTLWLHYSNLASTLVICYTDPVQYLWLNYPTKILFLLHLRLLKSQYSFNPDSHVMCHLSCSRISMLKFWGFFSLILSKWIYYSTKSTSILICVHTYFFPYQILKNLELWNVCLPFPTILSMGSSITDWLLKELMHPRMANITPCVSTSTSEEEEMPQSRTLLMKTNGHSFPKTFCIQNSFQSLKRRIVYFSHFLLEESTLKLFYYIPWDFWGCRNERFYL